MDQKYYIRTEGYVGNSLLWWRPKSAGYTTDIKKAGQYSKEEAESICRGSTTEAAYECDKIDNHPKALFTTVHADYIGYRDADITYRKS